MKDFKIEIPLPRSIVDPMFGDHNPVPVEQSPDAPEYAEANADLRELNRDIRDKEGRDVKTIKDMFER